MQQDPDNASAISASVEVAKHIFCSELGDLQDTSFALNEIVTRHLA